MLPLDFLGAKLLVFRGVHIQCIKGRCGLHAGDGSDKALPIQSHDLTILNCQVRLLLYLAARNRNTGKRLCCVVSIQLFLCRAHHFSLQRIQKAANAFLVQGQRCPVSCFQAKTVQISRKQCFQFPGNLFLLLGLGSGGALLHYLTVFHAHTQRAEIIVSAEHPLIGSICIFQIVDGTIAAYRKHIVSFICCANGR